MHRFLVSDTLGEELLEIENQSIYHQLVSVLRAKADQKYTFFDGVTPIDHVYSIESISKKTIRFKLVGSTAKNLKEKTIRLYQGLPNKWEKIEYIVQKGVEVGIQDFHFFKSELSQKIFVSESKIERIQKIAVEAVEQSGRNNLPTIKFYEKKSDVSFPKGQNILFHHINEKGVTMLSDVNFEESVNIFVGPEGGWLTQEVEAYEKL